MSRLAIIRRRILPVGRSSPHGSAAKVWTEVRTRCRIAPASHCNTTKNGGAGGIRTLERLLTVTHFPGVRLRPLGHRSVGRSAEHTSELQSLMRISYAACCLQNKN